MNVLQLNTYITTNGGSETVMENIGVLLRREGHTVMNVGFESVKVKHFMTDPVSLGVEKIELKSFFFNKKLVDKIIAMIHDNGIGLVICHNVYHKYPIADLLQAIKERTRATLMMVFHDYKAVCPRNNLYDGRHICTACSDGKFYQVALHKCRFGSFLHSSLLAMESYYNNSFRHAYQFPDILVSPSYFLAKQFANMGFKGHINVLHNPIEVNTLPRLPVKARLEGSFLYAGRFTKDKGLDLYLSLPAKFPGCRFYIAGHGELEEEVRKAAAEYTNLVFLGVLNKKELFQQFRQTDFLVLPAIWYENNPMIIIEAMTSGLPVLASSMGGIPELLEEGRGILFDPYQPGSLEEAVQRASTLRPDQYQLMAGKARLFAEDLDFQKYYEKLKQLVPALEIPVPTEAELITSGI